MGRKNRAFYRIIATDARNANQGGCLENLGWYDPKKTGLNFKINLERIDYWVGNGAALSNTVCNLVKNARLGKTPSEKTKKETPVPVNEKAAEEEAIATASNEATQEITS